MTSDFRRELGQAFDDMTGSPSAALPDRVRSSLSATPEQRGPFWIAGVAAAVIAAMVVGVLVVANVNRRETRTAPGAMATASPSAAVSPAAEPNLPAFQCLSSSAHLDYAQSPTQAVIAALRTGSHPGYDRLTIEWKGGPPWPTGPTNLSVTPQTGTTFTLGPSGQTVMLAGKNGILVIIHNADLHSGYSGSRDLKTRYATLLEVRQVEDFEGVVQLGLGVSGAACYRTFFLTNPDRLVIDIRAG